MKMLLVSVALFVAIIFGAAFAHADQAYVDGAWVYVDQSGDIGSKGSPSGKGGTGGFGGDEGGGDDDDGNNGHGNDDDGHDESNPGKGWGKGGKPGNPGKGHDK